MRPLEPLSSSVLYLLCPCPSPLRMPLAPTSDEKGMLRWLGPRLARAEWGVALGANFLLS